MKFASDLRQDGGFLRVLWFPPPIKLTTTITITPNKSCQWRNNEYDYWVDDDSTLYIAIHVHVIINVLKKGWTADDGDSYQNLSQCMLSMDMHYN